MMLSDGQLRDLVGEINSGMPIDVVREKYHPVLHASILAERALGAPIPRRSRFGASAPTWGFIYVFAAGPYTKVGMSDAAVQARWVNIKSANPLLEPPLFVSKPLGNRTREIERRIHAALRDHLECGEWFRCERALVLETVRRVIDGSR